MNSLISKKFFLQELIKNKIYGKNALGIIFEENLMPCNECNELSYVKDGNKKWIVFSTYDEEDSNQIQFVEIYDLLVKYSKKYAGILVNSKKDNITYTKEEIVEYLQIVENEDSDEMNIRKILMGRFDVLNYSSLSNETLKLIAGLNGKLFLNELSMYLDNLEIVRIAATNYPRLLSNYPKIQENRELLEYVIKNQNVYNHNINYFSYRDLLPKYKNDLEICKEFLKIFPLNYINFPIEIKRNIEVIKLFLQLDPKHYFYVPEEFHNNPQILEVEPYKQYLYVLDYIKEAKSIIKTNPTCFKNMIPEARDDYNVAYYAVKLNKENYSYVSKRLKTSQGILNLINGQKKVNVIKKGDKIKITKNEELEKLFPSLYVDLGRQREGKIVATDKRKVIIEYGSGEIDNDINFAIRNNKKIFIKESEYLSIIDDNYRINNVKKEEYNGYLHKYSFWSPSNGKVNGIEVIFKHGYRCGSCIDILGKQKIISLYGLKYSEKNNVNYGEFIRCMLDRESLLKKINIGDVFVIKEYGKVEIKDINESKVIVKFLRSSKELPIEYLVLLDYYCNNNLASKIEP